MPNWKETLTAAPVRVDAAVDGRRGSCRRPSRRRSTGASGSIGVREQAARARPGGHQEERRPERTALAGGAVHVERRRDAGRGDRLAHVGLGRRRERDVALSSTKRGRVGEVTGERPSSSAADVLAPGHVRRVARERDVGPRRVAASRSRSGRRRWRVRSALPRRADEVRDEHLLDAATSSSQVTQGEVGLAGFIVPAATRGSSAFAFGSLVQRAAAPRSLCDSPHVAELRWCRSCRACR